MLVTHYAIPLADHEVGELRQRIAMMGSAFDALPGLVGKLFLLATEKPCYSLYYLWRSPEALHDFLDGPLFGALVNRFGRPELFYYLTRESAWPFHAGQRIDCEAASNPSTSEHVALYELRSGGVATLQQRDTGRFEVVYVAGPHNL
jgi:hypothetical protein